MRCSHAILLALPLALPLALGACVPGVAEYTKTEAPAEKFALSARFAGGEGGAHAAEEPAPDVIRG
jgi:hypothetical protein